MHGLHRRLPEVSSEVGRRVRARGLAVITDIWKESAEVTHRVVWLTDVLLPDLQSDAEKVFPSFREFSVGMFETVDIHRLITDAVDQEAAQYLSHVLLCTNLQAIYTPFQTTLSTVSSKTNINAVVLFVAFHYNHPDWIEIGPWLALMCMNVYVDGWIWLCPHAKIRLSVFCSDQSDA